MALGASGILFGRAYAFALAVEGERAWRKCWRLWKANADQSSSDGARVDFRVAGEGREHVSRDAV
ncbi:hypothetical protein [Sinorhizobium medicae]|uniref:hypothetical protein n=1 Tax=Sinorhizobium medicae TaxID=110321 RepID=UPI00399D7774